MAAAKAVADFIVGVVRQHGDDISNLKLQKLLYYSQAWSLALDDTPLFPERIKAWVHGPVVPQVYHYFKDELHAKDWEELPNLDKAPHMTIPEVMRVNSVLEAYGHLSAYYLERLTHQEDPWRAARGDTPPNEPSEAEIDPELMRNFYRKMANEQQAQV